MSPGIAPLARIMLAGAWSQNRGRLVLTAIAIALGVALGTTVHLINYSAAAEFESAVRALSGDADLRVTGPRSGFDEALYPSLAQRPEVAVASPILEIDAKVADARGSLRIVGLDPFRALQMQPGLLGEAGEHLLDLLRPGTVMLSETAAHRLGIARGGTLAVQVGLRRVDLAVVAVIPSGNQRQPLALMDIASAQWTFDQIGRLSRIEMRLRAGISTGDFAAKLAADLPAGLAALEAERVNEQGLSLSRAYRVNLNMLALVSLFTGAVVVFCTQTLSVLRRRTQLGLLRALGISRRALTTLLVIESTALGALGALAGLAMGVLTAHLAIVHAGSDLGAGFFAGIIARTDIDIAGLALIGASGIVASTLGGLLPAMEAARADPANSLRAGDEQAALASMPSLGPALACLVSGGMLALLPAVDGLPVFGYAAIAMLLLGALMLVPQFVRTTLQAVPPLRSPLAWLGVRQLRGCPGYAGISLAGMLASFSLVVAMLIMIQSFRSSLDNWLGTVLPADLYARASGSGTGWLTQEAQAALTGASGVARIVFSRFDAVILGSDKPPVTLIARDMGEAGPDALPLVEPARLPIDGATPAWISEAVRDLHGLGIGDAIRLPIQGRQLDVRVAGIWRDYVRQGGSIVVPRDAYIRMSGDTLANDAWIWLQPGTSGDTAIERLRAALGAGSEIEIREPGRIRELSLAAFDRTFAVTYALQFAALVIGLFGISVGTSAQALARRREFGVLHHLGLSLRDLRRMVAIEGGFVGMLGACAGIVVGAMMSLVLIHVINRQSFHWTMEVHVPWQTLIPLALLLAACASVTAAFSVRSALGPDIVRAVKEDW